MAKFQSKHIKMAVGGVLIATVAIGGWRFAQNRMGNLSQVDAISINMAKPDVVIQSDQFNQLPAKLLSIPIVKDVLTEDVVFYYQEAPSKLSLQGALQRLAFDHKLRERCRAGLIAINMTPSHAWVAPSGSREPLLGTNPIGFGFPRRNPDEPYVFDFATSATARGEIQLHDRNGTPLPEGVAIDANGQPTTDPQAAMAGAMLTFGGHKGSAIATMVELLAGIAIGDMTSQESMAFADGTPTLPYGGEIIIAIDPVMLLGADVDSLYARGDAYLNQFNAAGSRLPSQRRFKARQHNTQQGYVTLDDSLYQDLQALLQAGL